MRRSNSITSIASENETREQQEIIGLRDTKVFQLARRGPQPRSSLYLECLDGLHGLLAYALDFVLDCHLGFCRVRGTFCGSSCLIPCFSLCGSFGS